MNHSKALMLLSSTKFECKALELINAGIDANLKHVRLEKKVGGIGKDFGSVMLEGRKDGEGGLMLYTSGTTNRPVSSFFW